MTSISSKYGQPEYLSSAGLIPGEKEEDDKQKDLSKEEKEAQIDAEGDLHEIR